MVWLGQRVTMILLLPLFLASWLTLTYSTSLWMLQTSRLLMGFIAGALEAASYGYATEITHRNLRGMLVGSVDTMRQVGMLLVYAVGSSSLTWRQLALVCGSITTVPVFVALPFLPDSPRWLVTRSRVKEALRSLTYFRGAHYNVSSEMAAIESHCKDKNVLSQVKLLRSPMVLKVTVLLAFLMFIVQFTGNIVVISYLVPIFNVAEVDIDSYMSAIIVISMRVVGTIFSFLVVDRLGRRPAIIISFLLISFSLMAFGAFYYLQDVGVDMSRFSWLPLTSLTLFTFFTCVGHPVLNLVRGELLPTSVRSLVAPFLFVVFFVGMFIAAEIYPWMVEAVGVYGAFWVYAGVSLLLMLVTVLFVPETRDTTLEEVAFVMPVTKCIRKTRVQETV